MLTSWAQLIVFLFIFVTVLPESPNFPYRRYDRLPPISQFSIESDSDLSETAELIEEYEVFDPCRPRPKVILVIGEAHTKTPTRAVSLEKNASHSFWPAWLSSSGHLTTFSIR